MTAIAPLVLNDTATTTRTYQPHSITGNLATWVDRSTSSLSQGQSVITISFDSVNSKRNTDKTILTLALPKVVAQVVNGVTVQSVISTARWVGGAAIVPGDWTQAERAVFAQLVHSLMAHQIFDDYVAGRSPSY